MNNIPQEQNKQPRLALLAAQRQLYSDAKFWQAVNIVTVVLVVVVSSILVAVFPSLAVYAAIWGAIATLLDVLFLSRLQKSTQEKAAQVQQDFDCQVLEFDRRSLHCGVDVEPELIIEASNKYKLKNLDYSALQNWYPIDIGQLPIHLARIICQRSNIWWDSNLRRRYSNRVISILLALIIIIFFIGLIGGLTIEKLVLAVIVPLQPIIILGVRQYIEHRETAARLDRLRIEAENILQEAIDKKLSQQDIEKASYSLQAQIYDNRRRSPFIFDWIYAQSKSKDEKLMNVVAEELVQQFIQKP